MRKDKHTYKIEPRFAKDLETSSGTVTLDLQSYLILLVKADVIDPHLWPPGLQDGAATLARVRQIEEDCKSQHGEFDWEKMSRAEQDEYDALCSKLDGMREDAPTVDWAQYKAGEDGA